MYFEFKEGNIKVEKTKEGFKGRVVIYIPICLGDEIYEEFQKITNLNLNELLMEDFALIPFVFDFKIQGDECEIDYLDIQKFADKLVNFINEIRKKREEPKVREIAGKIGEKINRILTYTKEVLPEMIKKASF